MSKPEQSSGDQRQSLSSQSLELRDFEDSSSQSCLDPVRKKSRMGSVPKSPRWNLHQGNQGPGTKWRFHSRTTNDRQPRENDLRLNLKKISGSVGKLPYTVSKVLEEAVNYLDTSASTKMELSKVKLEELNVAVHELKTDCQEKTHSQEGALKILQGSLEDIMNTARDRMKSEKQELAQQELVVQELINLRKEMRDQFKLLLKISADVKLLNGAIEAPTPALAAPLIQQNLEGSRLGRRQAAKGQKEEDQKVPLIILDGSDEEGCSEDRDIEGIFNNPRPLKVFDMTEISSDSSSD